MVLDLIVGKTMVVEGWKRSLVKAITYRALVIVLDFIFVFFLTQKTEVAAAFVVGSNVYTTVAYFIHERIWARSHWGTKHGKKALENKEKKT